MKCKAINRMTALRCHREALSNGYCELHAPEEKVAEREWHQCVGESKQSKRRCTKRGVNERNGQWFCALHDPALSKERSKIGAASARKRYGAAKPKQGRPHNGPAVATLSSVLAELPGLIRAETKAIVHDEIKTFFKTFFAEPR